MKDFFFSGGCGRALFTKKINRVGPNITRGRTRSYPRHHFHSYHSILRSHKYLPFLPFLRDLGLMRMLSHNLDERILF